MSKETISRFNRECISKLKITTNFAVVITPAIKYVKAVIPTQVGIQKDTGCPRLATYRGRLIKSGMTY